MRNRAMQVSLGCLLLAFGSPGAHAASTTQCGDTVCFTWDSEQLSVFGTPSVIGDQIIFDPTTFVAKSLNGEGVVSTNATVNIVVDVMDGYVFDSASLAEAGDYFLWGSDSAVSVGGQLRVRDAANTLLATDSITAGGDFDIFNTPMCSTPHNWDASADVSLAGAEWDGVTRVVMKIENILNAYTDSNDTGPLQAFIEKKEVGLSVGTSVIPIPAAVWLFGSGLLGLVGIARRKKPA
jgi:hypothetical protein